jgi:hypothetical protein
MHSLWIDILEIRRSLPNCIGCREMLHLIQIKTLWTIAAITSSELRLLDLANSRKPDAG